MASSSRHISLKSSRRISRSRSTPVVLGCTHYSFLQSAIRRIVGRTPEIIDGSYGIAMQLRRRLEAVDELNGSGVRGTVTFENSLDEPEILALSRALLDYEEEE